MLTRPRVSRASGGGGGGITGPANICVLSYGVTHNAATSCRDALVAGGHTVTITGSSVSNLSVHDFSQYDLIVTSRTNHADRAEVAAKLNELNNAGMPLIVGTVESGLGAGTGYSMVPTNMGITGTFMLDGAATSIDVRDNQHPITQGVALGMNTLFSVSNYMGSVESNQLYIGTELAWGLARGAIIAMEAGAARLNAGTPLGARIVLFPTYLISGAYTELHRTLLNQAVEWAI